MVKGLLLPLMLAIPFFPVAQDQVKSTEEFLSHVNAKVPALLEDFTIPGAAVAIIEDGKVVLQKGYGYADLDSETKVTTSSGFNIGSISKTVAAWGVMKLVEEGKLDLDVPAEQYLTRWHLHESEFDSDEVTIRRMLSHTAGLSLHGYPGWSPGDEMPTIEESLNGRNNGPGRVEIIMEPGTEYKYSGGGYTIMQLIIEEVTGQRFEDYIQAEVLDPLGMTNSSYKIDKTIMAASAKEYDNYGEEIDFELFTAQAAAGLHTTLEDFTRFALASLYRLEDNPVLPASVIKEMMTSVPEASGQYGYGLGYQVDFIEEASLSFSGHGGANSGWHAIFRVDPLSNDGFLVMTNGGAGYNVCNQMLCAWVEWKTGKVLGDWCSPKPSIAVEIKKVIDSEGADATPEKYTKLKEDYPDKYDFGENQLNSLGYYYMGRDELEAAITIFKINTDAFPYAYNTYDSYGEALLANGDREEAIENYKQSIRLNPDNANGFDVLHKLGVSTDDLLYKVPVEHLQRLAGEYVGVDDETWRIEVQVDNGVLQCKDKYYDFTLVPIEDNKYVNPRFGALWRFDTSDPDTDPVMLFGERRFNKVK